MAHPKGLLIERAQKLGLERPEFATVKTGPEHEPSFLSDVILAGEVLGTGQGGSKKDAERAAAEEALAALDKRTPGASSGRDARDERRGRAGRAAANASSDADAAATDAVQPAAEAASEEDDEMDEEFTGPWPMFDDLLASVVEVAERRIASDLRGDAARHAIRDFSLALYKELLANLGEVVEEDEDEDG